jgi:spore germination protein
MRNRIDRLTNLQVSFLVSSTIIGVTVLSLPRIAAELAKAAGPITTLITGILMALVLVIIALFAKRFPNDTIIEYSAELIGFIPSKILGLIFYIYFLGVASIILRLFCDTIKVSLLEITPLEIIMLTFLFASIYVAINGVSSLARLCETFEPLVIGAMGLVIILSFKNFNFEELLPAFKQDVLSWIYPIPSIALSYFGFEILLFITPFTKEPNKVLKYGLIGILPAILLYSAFVTVCIGTVFKYHRSDLLAIFYKLCCSRINFYLGINWAKLTPMIV